MGAQHSWKKVHIDQHFRGPIDAVIRRLRNECKAPMVACTEGDLGALVVTVIGRQNGTTVIREEFTISATNWHPNAQHYLVPARDARDEC